jgi:3-phytase
MKKITFLLSVLFLLIFGFASCKTASVQTVSGPKVIGAKKEAVELQYTEDRTDNFIYPIAETGKTGYLNGDADDPAIWIHPTDSSRSVIFGIDKADGLWAWDMEGNELGSFDPSGKPGNVDVRYGLEMGGKEVDIVAFNLRRINYEEGSKIAVYGINPDYTSGEDLLTVLSDGTTDNNALQSGTYGFGLYKNPETGLIYAFENAAVGNISQYLIEDDGSGERIKLTHVRDLEYDGIQCEGMVADDELGFFYVGEEGVAVHKYYAAPDMPTQSILTFAPKSDGYSRDREGISLYECDDGPGYLLVVDQGQMSDRIPSIIRIYDREGDNKLVKTVALMDRDGKPLWDEDGVESTSTPIMPNFPNGLVIGHDGAHATYPMYDWKDIAGDDLHICGE